MDVDGVRAVNYVTLTQDLDYNAEAAGGGTEIGTFSPGLYTTSDEFELEISGTTDQMFTPIKRVQMTRR